MPCAANIPASESPSEMWMRGGGSSGKPLMWRMPPIASETDANPARGAYGPVWPYPETRAITSPGLTSQSRSGARFQRSSVPGRKFSTRTSLCSTSASRSSCPRSSRRLSVTHFLFRDWTGHQSERPS